jgi:hypothetical protein
LPNKPKLEIALESCVDNTKQKPIDVSNATATSMTDQEDELIAILGVPIWNHGILAQAKLTPVRHAVHSDQQHRLPIADFPPTRRE